MTEVLTNKYDAAVYARAQETALASDEQTRSDLQSIKWGGWALIGTLAMGWLTWVSLTVQDNRTEVVRMIERQSLQYEQLREDMIELKTLILKQP